MLPTSSRPADRSSDFIMESGGDRRPPTRLNAASLGGIHDYFARELAALAHYGQMSSVLEKSCLDGGLAEDGMEEVLSLLGAIEDRLDIADAWTDDRLECAVGLLDAYRRQLQDKLRSIQRDSFLARFRPFGQTHAVLKRIAQLHFLATVKSSRTLDVEVEECAAALSSAAINGQDENGKTLLMRCADPRGVKALLACPHLNVNQSSAVSAYRVEKTFSALTYALAHQSPDKVKALLAHPKIRIDDKLYVPDHDRIDPGLEDNRFEKERIGMPRTGKEASLRPLWFVLSYRADEPALLALCIEKLGERVEPLMLVLCLKDLLRSHLRQFDSPFARDDMQRRSQGRSRQLECLLEHLDERCRQSLRADPRWATLCGKLAGEDYRSSELPRILALLADQDCLPSGMDISELRGQPAALEPRRPPRLADESLFAEYPYRW
ncbi:MAG TPA: hypothetical protein VEC06_07405 [Paucimonas sp.]|nr:hypothetical protein [Paucimonas sp.]